MHGRIDLFKLASRNHKNALIRQETYIMFVLKAHLRTIPHPPLRPGMTIMPNLTETIPKDPPNMVDTGM